MEQNIIDVLQNEGSLATKEIAIKVGYTKAKDIQKTLNKLLKSDVVTKRKVNNNLLWVLSNEQTDLVDAAFNSSVDKNKQTQTTTNSSNGINSSTKDISGVRIS